MSDERARLLQEALERGNLLADVLPEKLANWINAQAEDERQGLFVQLASVDASHTEDIRRLQQKVAAIDMGLAWLVDIIATAREAHSEIQKDLYSD